MTDNTCIGVDFSDDGLEGEDFKNYVLTECDFSGADLSYADFTGATITDCDFAGTYLRGAVLSFEQLMNIRFYRATMEDAQDDFFNVMRCAPNEVPGVLKALREGRIDGTVYEGACACLKGTIANLQGVHYDAIPNIPVRASLPAERLFFCIHEGDTPQNNPLAALVESWILAWLAERN